MADYIQDTGRGTWDGEKSVGTKGEIYKDAADYAMSVSVSIDPELRTDPAYKVPDGLSSYAIREVTKADIPAEWWAKGMASAAPAGFTRDPDFVGIHNEKGRASLYLAWN